jgi:quercetin dioxygenase-like cupin family protein
MKESARAFTPNIAGRETVMEGADMRAVVLTLDRGQNIPWHYHSRITDAFVCLKGPMVVETRAPRATYVLNPGERCAVPPMTAHFVHGQDGGPCAFLILQGAGEYDNVLVGGQQDS